MELLLLYVSDAEIFCSVLLADCLMVEALPSKFDGHYSSESSLADLLKNINNDEVGHMKAIFGGFRSRFSNAALHLSAV